MENDILILRINSIIKHIDELLKDTENITLKEFQKSNLVVRASCFSLVQIGEQMIKVEEFLKEKYPNIPWRYARNMRNIIVHDYGKVDFNQIYTTIKNDLNILYEEFIKVKRDIEDDKYFC